MDPPAQYGLDGHSHNPQRPAKCRHQPPHAPAAPAAGQGAVRWWRGGGTSCAVKSDTQPSHTHHATAQCPKREACIDVAKPQATNSHARQASPTVPHNTTSLTHNKPNPRRHPASAHASIALRSVLPNLLHPLCRVGRSPPSHHRQRVSHKQSYKLQQLTHIASSVWCQSLVIDCC